MTAVFLAVLSAVAGGIHGTVAPEHWREYWLFGVFFAAVATVQIAWALAVLARPSRLLLGAGAVANVAVALLWIASRTVGIPLGPGDRVAEAAGFVDVLTTVYEVGIAAVAMLLLREDSASGSVVHRPRVFPNWEATVLSGALGVAALISASAHAAVLAGSPRAASEGPGTHGLHLLLVAGAGVAALGYGVARRFRKAGPGRAPS